jgi:hypothetical protein
MPKKSKRQVRKTPAAIAPVAAAPVQTVTPTRLATAAEFDPDYTYVVHDLRRIGILVLSFTVVLVVLSFFI